MGKVISLIDANNFYASCEQSINPSLIGRPLVVLSNNDGCIIARNTEARKLGIAMGQPYFKIRYDLEALGVVVRSSNYELYGDISKRLMNILKENCEAIEIYSIDEAFALFSRQHNYELHSWAQQLRAKTSQYLGIAISIGIGKTKSQAKIANYLAKTIPYHAGIFNLNVDNEADSWLKKVPIEKVWGIGKKLSEWCRTKGITNALQLRDMPSNELSERYGITGIRIQQEIKGIECLPLIIKSQLKKETCVSRSFSRPITSLEELRQAISTHVARASEKLREQKQYANVITIFIQTNRFLPFYYSNSATKKLIVASNDTANLIKESLPLLERIFRPNYSFTKAGVLLQHLQRTSHLQNNLLATENIEEQQRKEKLMQTIDNLNHQYGNGTIKWAICGNNQDWDMQRKQLSKASTTRIEDIPRVKA